MIVVQRKGLFKLLRTAVQEMQFLSHHVYLNSYIDFSGLHLLDTNTS